MNTFIKTIPFEKITSCGNNFIVVDERLKCHVPECLKRDVAREVTDGNFGVGADGFIVLQPGTPEVLQKINSCRHYWKELPAAQPFDYIFRMFEPTGEESFCCGNGLLCMALYLYQTTGVTMVRILTEIPGNAPVVRTLGYDMEKRMVWVNMGTPVKIPDHLARPKGMVAVGPHLTRVPFEIPLSRLAGICPPVGQQVISFSGYLTFSGEPHLVIVFDHSLNHNSAVAGPACSSAIRDLADILKQGILSFETDPFNAIGLYLNHQLRAFFPVGINVNIVSITDMEGVIEHRCFERGIEKETLACGTGMVAAVSVLHALGRTTCDTLKIHPLKCREYRPGTAVTVEKKGAYFVIHGMPVRICTGVFHRAEGQNGYASSFPRNKKMGVEV